MTVCASHTAMCERTGILLTMGNMKRSAALHVSSRLGITKAAGGWTQRLRLNNGQRRESTILGSQLKPALGTHISIVALTVRLWESGASRIG